MGRYHSTTTALPHRRIGLIVSPVEATTGFRASCLVVGALWHLTGIRDC